MKKFSLNTTLVKVKSYVQSMKTQQLHSNTTLVKVKLSNLIIYFFNFLYSNTTLVKLNEPRWQLIFYAV